MGADHRTRMSVPFRTNVAAAAGFIALIGAVLGGLAWSQPTRATAVMTYTQTGALSYSAPTASTSVYGTAGVRTGDPVHGQWVSAVDITYVYRLSAPSAHVSGTERLVATISDSSGISRSVDLQPLSNFSGRSFSTRGVLQLSALQQAATELGDTTASSLSVSISPSVVASGTVGTAPLKVTFNQKTGFQYTPGSSTVPGTLTTDVTTAPNSASPPPKGRPIVSQANGSLSVPDGRAATIRFISVAEARFISLALLLVGLAIGCTAGVPVLRDATSDDERVRIGARHGSSLIRIESLDGVALATVALPSFESLQKVAQQLGCPLLQHGEDGGKYSVVDNGTVYRYQVRASTARSDSQTVMVEICESEPSAAVAPLPAAVNGSR